MCATERCCPTEGCHAKKCSDQAVPKAGVLRISNGVKRPSSVEPSQALKGKHAMVNVALSPASTPIHRAIARPQPLTEYDDGRVAVCAMLEAPSMVSSSSLSSSDSSGSESIMASPLPIPDLLISAGLQDMLEMLEVEAAH
jgi:hypothetical protein